MTPATYPRLLDPELTVSERRRARRLEERAEDHAPSLLEVAFCDYEGQRIGFGTWQVLTWRGSTHNCVVTQGNRVRVELRWVGLPSGVRDLTGAYHVVVRRQDRAGAQRYVRGDIYDAWAVYQHLQGVLGR